MGDTRVSLACCHLPHTTQELQGHAKPLGEISGVCLSPSGTCCALQLPQTSSLGREQGGDQTARDLAKSRPLPASGTLGQGTVCSWGRDVGCRKGAADVTLLLTLPQ